MLHSTDAAPLPPGFCSRERLASVLGGLRNSFRSRRIGWLPGVAILVSLAVISGGRPFSATAMDPAAHPMLPNRERLAELVPDTIPGYQRVPYGVTRHGTPLIAWQTEVDRDAWTKRRRVLLVGGLDGAEQSSTAILAGLRWFASDEAASLRARVALSAAPLANPDGIAAGAGTRNLSQGTPSERFPPEGPFYGHPRTPEANYLWRWVGIDASDLVVEVRAGAETKWQLPTPRHASPSGPEGKANWSSTLARALGGAEAEFPAASFVAAINQTPAADLGTIPAIQLTCSLENYSGALRSLCAALADDGTLGESPARQAWQARLSRTPREVLEQLSQHYAKSLPVVEYIPAMALVARLRWGELSSRADERELTLKLVEPYVQGERPTTPKSGSGQSGHLLFVELARSASTEAERAAYIKLVRNAADQAFGPHGKPLDVMPFHLEMSDAFFMGGPILAAAGRLTGEPRYWDACQRHLATMTRLDLRPDGLYRHSPLDETAWGRGNGFVALGLALCLVEAPEPAGRTADPMIRALVAQHERHLRALLRHQDATGCWHQVIDHPESYAELSCTCMITWALARGIRGGWLDRATFEGSVERGWDAIRRRVGSDGRLIDICTGTGKQQSLREYYDREAILGPDPRGGAMAMLVAAELAEYFASRGESRRP